jgi:hypothetical protein
VSILLSSPLDPFLDGMSVVWRTSTPEPTTAGIIWTYVKDVTRYTPLFAKPGTFILELDNIVQVKPISSFSSLPS